MGNRSYVQQQMKANGRKGARHNTIVKEAMLSIPHLQQGRMNVTQVTSSIRLYSIQYRLWPTKRERTRGLGPILGLNLPSKGHCIKAKDVDFGLHSFICLRWNREELSSLLCVVLSPFFSIYSCFVAMHTIDSPFTALTILPSILLIPSPPTIA